MGGWASSKSLFILVALFTMALGTDIMEPKLSDVRADQMDGEEMEILFPRQLQAERIKRDVSTATEKGHIDEASFILRTKSKDLILDVKRNKGLLSPAFAVRSFSEDDSEVLHQDPIDHCYYHGEVRGSPHSDVALTTCQGKLRGVIDDGEGMFIIEPHEDAEAPGAHKFYPARTSDVSEEDETCGNGNEFSFKRGSAPQAKLTRQRSVTVFQFRRDIDAFYEPYFATKETRYNEMYFCVDHEMYLGHDNDTKYMTERIITLVNAVDRAYQRINIRLVIKGIEFWSNGDFVEYVSNGGTDLSHFRDFRNEILIPRAGPNDNAHLLRNRGWDDHVVGMAYVNGMCTGNSAAVDKWDYGSIIGPYVVLGHEMGHNFGFSHDTGTCKCLTPRGCFMGGHKTAVPGFSNCSMESLKKVHDECLYNVPTESLNEVCGNGIREGDEECDCGSPAMCKEKDPCCEPHKCVLRSGTQCSDLHHECCENCLFRKQGSLCRAEKTDCDVPEYCTGDSRDCPGDSYIQDGYPCNRTTALIQANVDLNHEVTKKLHPRVEARYVRISPQYYHDWMCLRMELYGCSSDQVSPTSPSPISSYRGHCVRPQEGSCSPKDGSYVIFSKQGECTEDFMEFSLDEEGVLRHQCSGKMVCPEGGSTSRGAKLTVSNACDKEASKFERTAGYSLKHIKTGRCIHPSGGWPGVNVRLIVWGSCDETRLQLRFMKQDCVIPLGMADGRIPDDQITASSHRESDFAYNARLNGPKSWCSKNKKSGKDEYIQVDLGEMKTIGTVGMQGRGSWYYWITAYHLYYSEDGEIWTPYTESGDQEHSNANCYLGKCSETHETQCQDLWGGTAHNGDTKCYTTLNTNGEGYGTCAAKDKQPCASKDVLCGQLQCLDKRDKPDRIDFGKNYTRITLDSGQECSAAILHDADGDSLGRGMVQGGTKCGDGKMCIDNKCQSFEELGIQPCPAVDGKICGGRGLCTNEGKCQCSVEYDPDTACQSALVPRDGRWGEWADWSICTKGCNGGKRTRHRFCDNPFPRYGGADCAGNKEEEDSCNTHACPVGISCRHIQQQAKEENMDLPDGIYTIDPTGDNPIPAYCDFTRDGGGWTLLVTSHTNSWTSENVLLRNEDTPQLKNDYSILSVADTIKSNIYVYGSTFEYRLEASEIDHWGGIWEAPRSYSFVSKDNKQTSVELIKKFDEWEYKYDSISKRMPWVADARLTTSEDAYKNWYGSVTGDEKDYHPAPWIRAHLAPKQPSHIWYWMREGPYTVPRSCGDLQLRGFFIKSLKDGVFTIKPPGEKEVQTYCDMTTNGGGWTLMATSKTHSGWTKENALERNSENPLNEDFSILKAIDAIKDFGPSQEFYQYRIDAQEGQSWGGIWEAPMGCSALSSCGTDSGVELLQSYDDWSKANNLATNRPKVNFAPNVFLSAASSFDELSGSIIYNDAAAGASYLHEKPHPDVVRFWIREGTRRSCNDIKLHGVRAGNSYEDGFYMIQLKDKAQYLPVYCDMTTEEGAFTLLVTSAHNGWTPAQVLSRNRLRPALYADYSILDLGDTIKSLSNAETFQYMLDANQRRHWGGIFEAPMSYSFVATSPAGRDKGVTLKRKFNDWEFSWWKSLNRRMPWVVALGSNKALLTTSYSATSNPSGSILWEGDNRFPAEWIWDGMKNPGVIWYWVNEDDCDADRKPVDGGWTEWSSWGRCDQLCENGKEIREKTCTNPKPRCGGKQCDSSPLTVAVEGRPCYYCPESPIRTVRGHYCVVPEKPSCSAADLEDSYLRLRKQDENCTAEEDTFVFDHDGVIHHKCSKMMVCPEGGKARYSKLILKSECDRKTAMHERLKNLALKNKQTGYCVHPGGGWPKEGTTLGYWHSCPDEERIKLEFLKLAPP